MNKKILGAALGATALLGGAMVSTAPIASADPLPHAGAWYLAYTSTGNPLAQVNDPISGTAILKFQTAINFTPTDIECQVPLGLFTYDLQSADLGPHAASSVVDLDLVPPPVISDSADGVNAVCQDVSGGSYPTGLGLDVSTDGFTPWATHLTTPAPPTGGHVYTGTTDATVDIPEDAIDFWDPTTLCGAVGPSDSGGITASGDYDTTNGVLTPDTPQPFTATPVPHPPNPTCVIGDTGAGEASLQAGSTITLSPVLTVKWLP